MIDGPRYSDALMTAEDLLVLDVPGKSTELVRGRLIVREPPGTYHGRVQGALNVIVGSYVRANRLGNVFGQDTGFRIASDPDTVRAPDFAFVSRDRADRTSGRGYATLAPDLVAEILSPDDRPGEALAKVGEWLEAGVKLVWLIDPERRVASAYHRDGAIAAVAPDGLLEGGDVLPGFTCRLSEIFE